jgi:glycosyltransferase involved in cell wall biosynthesis
VRVLIDGHMVGSRETGNETYVVHLLSGIAESSSVQLAAAVSPNLRLPTALQNGAITKLSLLPFGNWSRLLWALPRLCRRWKADILHVTYIAPFVLPCPCVVSVHDISFRRYPMFFSPRDRLLFATLLPLTLRRAQAVLTLSDHAKAELLDAYPGLVDRVHVTPLAPSPMFQPIDDSSLLDTIRQRYGLKHDFVMAVGNVQPRKNLIRLIRAFALIRDSLNGCQLAIVGKAQWRASKAFDMVQSLGLKEDVRFTGYVSTEDLLALYNAARVLVYPSLYEGFGLPVLEAMACGTPVICSDATSLPEVAGDAALLIDPHREDELARAIQGVVLDASLAESLSTRGLRRAREFSWKRTADETVGIYRKVRAR